MNERQSIHHNCRRRRRRVVVDDLDDVMKFEACSSRQLTSTVLRSVSTADFKNAVLPFRCVFLIEIVIEKLWIAEHRDQSLYVHIEGKHVLSRLCNRTACIRDQCRKTTVFNCHRCLINTGVEKNEHHLNIDKKFDHHMSLSKSRFWYSNHC